MKALIIAPYLPFPPNSGGKIRIFEEIKYLGRRHDLHLVSLADPFETRYTESLKRYCRGVNLIVRSGFKPPPTDSTALPLPVLWYWSVEMEKALSCLSSESFDVILFEHIYAAQYQHLFDSDRTILSEHNIESDILEQMASAPTLAGSGFSPLSGWKLRAAKMHLAAYEDRSWQQFPMRFVVSREDRSAMMRRCPVGRTLVVENGVDVESIHPIKFIPSRRILFMGAMDYPPNIDGVVYFVEMIWPEILEIDDRISLIVSGRNPSPEIMKFGARSGIEVVPNPENMQTVAETCAITVVPLRIGGGTRLKILHAMAMGLPVISTSLGCAGLEVRNERDLLIRDDPESFARAIVELLNDPSKLLELRRNGRKLVEKRYHWPKIMRKMEAAVTRTF